MKPRHLKGRGLGTSLAICAALLGACGDDDETARAKPQAPMVASIAVLDKDPYAITCGNVRDQQTWADATRSATVAIADRERIAGLNRLQATQSVFYAMTELCKGRAASFKPANAAADAVRTGRYRAAR